MHGEFQELYRVFEESSYDCLDPQSTVRLGKADLGAASFSDGPGAVRSGCLLTFSLCISLGPVTPGVFTETTRSYSRSGERSGGVFSNC